VAGTAVIAIGGNSLVRAGQRGTVAEQLANARLTARNVARLVSRGWRVVLTHGNGPQVGAALLRSERAASEAYPLPLDVCVASTQSEIGYLLQRAMEEELRAAGVDAPVLTVLTRVRVDEDDPAFSAPSKPVGPFYSHQAAAERERTLGWAIVEDSARGYRRVVPSPEPIAVLETDLIRRILDLGVIPIACGGGGIPVVVRPDGSVAGSEAVIDKDRASALLATALGVDLLVISTDATHVFLDYRTPRQRPLGRLTAAELDAHRAAGQFPPGSMGPKVESVLRFLRAGGREAVVTAPSLLADAVEGDAGTHILP
jgi:carbamate kinase